MLFLILLLQGQLLSHTPSLVNVAESINDQSHPIRSHLTSRSGQAVTIKRFQKMMYPIVTMESNHEADSISKSHPNSVSVVQMVERSELGLQFSPRSKNLIGIYFGTSTIAICFMISASDRLYQFKIQEEDVDFYIPTVLLIDEHNKVEIGSRALDCYAYLEVDF